VDLSPIPVNSGDSIPICSQFRGQYTYLDFDGLRPGGLGASGLPVTSALGQFRGQYTYLDFDGVIPGTVYLFGF